MSRTRLISIGDAFAISGGLSATRAELGRNGLCYLHYGDIHASSKTTLDTEIDYNDIPKLDIPLSRVTTTSRLLDGDVVFVDASEDDEGTSRYVVIQNNKGIPFIAGLHTIVAKPKIREFDTSYLCYVFSSRFVKRQFIHYAVGTKVSGVNKKTIQNILIPCPSLNIQRHIGLTLAHIDRQVESIKRLISKQEAIKKGTLKLLLEPQSKTRLISIGDAFNITGGMSASRADLGKTGLCYLHYGDIHASSKTTIDTDLDYNHIPKLDIQLSRVSSDSLLADGDVVFVDASEDDEGTSRYVAIQNSLNIPFIAGLHTIVAKPKQVIFDNGYLAYVFSTSFVRKQFVHYAVGTKVSGVNKRTIQSILIPCPSMEQQHHIGKQLYVLSSVLEPLYVQLAKAQQIKQGMMRYFFGD